MKKKAKKKAEPSKFLECWYTRSVFLTISTGAGRRAGFIVEKQIRGESKVLPLATAKSLPEARRCFDEQIKVERGVAEGS